MANILIVDDLDRTMELCRRSMPTTTLHGPVRNWKETEQSLAMLGGSIDVVLLDVCFERPAEELIGLPPDADERTLRRVQRRQGLEILARLRKQAPDLPVILMTSRADLPLERQAEVLDAQEYTYFLDDDYVDAQALQARIAGILRARQGELTDGPVFWGRCLLMRQIRQRLITLSRGRLPVILSGPTGTGKSLIARHFIHQRSARPGKFVSVDLSTMPRDLMASHLFGSVKGAWTGSVADRPGAFEVAHRGTLFLDEVGNLSQDAQRMLLGVLQEGKVTRLGDVRERAVDVKVVVASHEDLGEMVRQGRFRPDLYMRLNPACTVQMPALRERMEDLPELMEFCVGQSLGGPYLEELFSGYAERVGLSATKLELALGDEVPTAKPGVLHVLLSDSVMRQLRRHPWSGNLREFAMTVENALTFTLAELEGVAPGHRADVIAVRPKLIRELLRAVRIEMGTDQGGFGIRVKIEAHDSLNELSRSIERQYFTTLYLQEEGDFAAMAQVLMGDASCARKVQLRFNQLGLRVRDLRAVGARVV